tara:strand:- start:3830 stop:4087 length:258 start_codon:yes stop_codon:yes gene_type:complete
MTTLQNRHSLISECDHNALIDQLRACTKAHEILEFEKWFNSNSKQGPLHELVCELLKNRSISRAIAAKWLYTLLKDKDEQIKNKS